MTTVIGLDLGTSSSKAAAVTASGRILAKAATPVTLESPSPGWAVQDPHAVWEATAAALREVAERADGPLHGICLSGAMHSLFPVDVAGAPLASAMTWADRRGQDEEQKLRARTDPRQLYLKTGCPVRYMYHLPRLAWWRSTHPELWRSGARFVSVKEWIVFCLTGEWAVDLSLASTTGMMDLRRLEWDPEALDLAGLRAGHLSPLRPPTHVVGAISDQAARSTGLPSGLPVILGASDGALANLGSGAVDRGDTVVTVGTSAAIRRVVTEPHMDPDERTWCYLLVPGEMLAGGAINNGGLALDWVRSVLYSELSPAAGRRRLLEDADAISPGCDGVLMLPYLTGERSPHWDAGLCATVTGLRKEHGRAHMARAALEGVAFCLADVWDALSGLPLPDSRALLTGGITLAPVWQQIVSDVLGIAMQPLQAADASVLGAAILGHFALGHLTTLRPPGLLQGEAPPVFPIEGNHRLYQHMRARFQTVRTGTDLGIIP